MSPLIPNFKLAIARADGSFRRMLLRLSGAPDHELFLDDPDHFAAQSGGQRRFAPMTDLLQNPVKWQLEIVALCRMAYDTIVCEEARFCPLHWRCHAPRFQAHPAAP